MANGLGTPGGVVSDEHHRLALAGMVAPQTSSLAVRTGVLPAPGSTALITGTSATGTMTVSVAAHHWVTTRGAADGVYLGTVEAATTVNIAAAPGANSRIDVIYVKQNDAGSTITPDGSTAMVVGAVTGTAAVSPTKPSLPVGAIELGTVTVAAGATATNGSGVTISNTAVQTVARGADVPVRNQAERDALTTYPLLTVKRLDTGATEQRNATNSGWITVFDPATQGSWTAMPVIGAPYIASFQATGVAHAGSPSSGAFQYRVEGSRVVLRGWTFSSTAGYSGNAPLLTPVLPAAVRPATMTTLWPINSGNSVPLRHEIDPNGQLYLASGVIPANTYVAWEGVSWPVG